MVCLYFIVRMLFATFCSSPLLNLILFTPYATSCIRLLEKRKSRKCSTFAMVRRFILECFAFSGIASPTHSGCNFRALSTMYLEQLKVFMVSSLVYLTSPRNYFRHILKLRPLRPLACHHHHCRLITDHLKLFE